MQRRDFDAFQRSVFASYAKGEYQAALARIEAEKDRFPDKKAQWLYWQLCFNGLLKNTAGAKQAMQDALRSGIWWSPRTLAAETDFAAIRGEPSFAAFRDAMEAALLRASQGAQAVLLRAGPENASRRVLNLHWRGDKAANYQRYFQPLLPDLEMLFIQSSQPSSSEGFCWDDHEQAIQDVEGLLGASLQSLDAIIGSSQGGVIALKLAAIYSRPYFGVMPAFSDPAALRPLFKPDGKYRFLIGTADRFYSAAAALQAELAKGGVDTKLVTMADAGHFFPQDFLTYFNPIIEELLA